MHLYIEAWDWDQGNVDKLSKRGLTPEMIEDDIWLGAPSYNHNRRGRAATHIMIGPDRGGALRTICIYQVDDDTGLWRAVSGWRSKPHEEAWYGRAR